MAAGIISNILGSALGDTVAKIVGAFKVPPEAQLEAQVQLEEIRTSLEQTVLSQYTAQLAVDQQEAASKSMFVAGWRPFIGWICGIGLGTQFLVGPLFTWVVGLAGLPMQFPPLDTATLLTLLFGMLGLGGMRTYEKINGASTTKISG